MLRYAVTRPRIITLTTDFGLDDGYVAAVKGVILGIVHDVTIVDVTHFVAPQDVGHAARVLDTVWPYFPEDTIHVAVVDPGVGTARRAIALRAADRYFVGPDNGIFCPALIRAGCVALPQGSLINCEAVELANPDYRLPQVSQTFHGRDIFAPAAAHLARGVPLADLGPCLDRLQCPDIPRPRVETGVIRGIITHVDHFGNAVSNVPSTLLPPRARFEVAGRVIRGVAAAYQDAEVTAIVGSTGMVEIAIRNGSAAETLGIRRGDELVVRSDQ